MRIRHVMPICMVIISLVLTFRTSAAAEDSQWYDRVGFSIGAAYEVGMMENNGMGIPSRTMTAGSVQTLLSYEILKN